MWRIWIYVLLSLFLFSCSQTKLKEVVSSVTRSHHTVEQRQKQFGPAARARWQPYFRRAALSYPPKEIIIVGLKEERVVEIYANNELNLPRLLRTIPICAASGIGGPKLREGDLQVPEGIYQISFLNANSRFHLSLKVDYPNGYDRFRGQLAGEANLGGDIMIHGGCLSTGCLAIGDQAAEDLFILAADSGISNIKVILTPFDFRQRVLTIDDVNGLPAWTPELYEFINEHLEILDTPFY